MTEKVYLSKSGVKKLEEELHKLKYKIRPEISSKVSAARELGDLKENAEYHAAREELSLCETKIQQIQSTLAHVEIIDAKDLDHDVIHIFSKVTLKNIQNKKIIEYTLVSQEEADLKIGKISLNSPVGKGLIGHRQGEKVEIDVPAGKLNFEILKIVNEV